MAGHGQSLEGDQLVRILPGAVMGNLLKTGLKLKKDGGRALLGSLMEVTQEFRPGGLGRVRRPWDPFALCTVWLWSPWGRCLRPSPAQPQAAPALQPHGSGRKRAPLSRWL